MTIYTVTATRSHGLWELKVDHIGVTQSRKASGAEAMIRDFLCIMEAEDAETATIDIEWHLSDDLDRRIRTTRATTAEAARLQSKAASAAREIIALLKAEGLSGRDIAIILGLSEQRVSQLSKSADTAALRAELQAWKGDDELADWDAANQGAPPGRGNNE